MHNITQFNTFVATDCKDDPAVDCAHINTLFGICGDVNHAKVVCPRFCKLCNVGKSVNGTQNMHRYH